MTNAPIIQAPPVHRANLAAEARDVPPRPFRPFALQARQRYETHMTP